MSPVRMFSDGVAADAVEIYAMLLGIPVDLNDPELALLAAVERAIRDLISRSHVLNIALEGGNDEDRRT